MSEPTYVPVRAGERRWLIPSGEVLDVRETAIDAVVPGAPPFLPGMVAYRGRLIAVARLDILLNDGGATPCPRLVVLRHETDPVALSVSAVDPVTSLTSAVDADLGWDLPDEVALVARGTTPLPGGETGLVLDTASLHRFVRSACYKFWRQAPPPGSTFPGEGARE